VEDSAGFHGGAYLKKITVVIPAFNEQSRIQPTLRDIAVFMRKYPDLIREVIVVDDASKDQTSESVISMVDELPVRLISHAKNGGKWWAIRTGMENAKTDAVLLLDADNSVNIWQLERLQSVVLQNILDSRVSVFSTRFWKNSKVEGKSLKRTVISHGYRLFVKFMYWYATGRKDVNDMQCPWKLIFKSTLLDMMRVERWSGDIELACCIQGKITNMPVHFIHMQGGTIKNSTIFSMFFETIRVARRFRKMRNE
jgi:dolichyl-phosphate beta-glucosyltransferase